MHVKVWGALLALLPTAAWAQSGPAVEYDAFDLADRKIVIPGGGADGEIEADLSGDPGPCSLSMRAGALTGDPDACPGLWRSHVVNQRTLRIDGVPLPLVPRSASASPALRYDAAAGAVVGYLAPGSRVAFPTANGFVALEAVEVGRVAITPDVLAGVARGEITKAFVRSPDGRLAAASVSVGAPSPEATGTPPGAVDRVEAEGWVCPPAGIDPETTYVYCVDARPGAVNIVGPMVVKPNREFLVMVKRPEGTGLKVELGGTAGLYPPPARQRSGAVPVDVVTRHPFAPRKPATIRLDVSLLEAGPDRRPTVTDAAALEIVVQPTYNGSLNIGFASLFGGAIDGEYTARQIGTSAQAEVSPKNVGGLELEMVAGYSIYLDRGGRGPLGCEQRPSCFGPYMAIGLIDGPVPRLRPFKSFHLGVAWEPAPNLSFALTGVLRQVDRLADGLRVGSPIVGDDVPTQNRYGVGIGVVANLTPDFLKFAMGGR